MSSTVHEPLPYEAPAGRLSFPGLVRAELIKLWSVRSSVVMLIVASLLIVGLSVVMGSVTSSLSDGTAGDLRNATITSATTGAQFATLIAAAIGAVVMTSECSSGLIRVSLTVVPRRLPLLWAKAVAVSISVGAALGAAVLVAFLVSAALLAPAGLPTGLTDLRTAGLLLGNVLALVGIALVGLALGTITRSTVGAVCSVVGLVFVLPVVLLTLPAFPGKDLFTRFNLASSTLGFTTPEAESLGGSTVPVSLAVFVLWVGALLLLAAVVLRNRDV